MRSPGMLVWGLVLNRQSPLATYQLIRFPSSEHTPNLGLVTFKIAGWSGRCCSLHLPFGQAVRPQGFVAEQVVCPLTG